jgi:hypothetical protein
VPEMDIKSQQKQQNFCENKWALVLRSITKLIISASSLFGSNALSNNTHSK